MSVQLSTIAGPARACRVTKMRTALICVLLTTIIQLGITQSDDFRPTPIPLDQWHPSRRESRTEVVEAIQTDSPSSATVPAHYWEDALRHSVYLTLVRDKIDQLIAKGDAISSNSKTGYESKEIDDHDLWNKIKSAPFNRLPDEEPAAGDVVVMAKGRLLENKQGFSFLEDELLKPNCSDDKCLHGVKAFWSVKRVRQRDHELSQGKYHYELTFSVTSQTPKKQKKPHENNIRTFTVRETFPKGIIDRPQEYRKFDAPKFQTRRPERAVWIHKNIAPVKQIGRRQFFQGFDKIFTSLFSDDDARDYDGPATKYKLNPNGFPLGHQYSKIGHLGVPTDQHQIPYPYRLNQNKQIRPPLSLPINPIQQTYLDMGQITTANSNLYSLYPYAHRDTNNGMKTTRPAVLPTPLPPLPQRDYSVEATLPISLENIDNITTVADAMKYQLPYNKYKPIPVKVNYFPEHVRPPVYNAPPGVFVTMDKKPFKPLPPLKYLHLSKPHRLNRPVDFRPSPQVMDVLFSDPDSFADTAFKPITVGYDDNTTNIIELTDSRKKSETKTRKTTLNEKKQLKKHENIKRVSTAVPEIITAQSLTEESIESFDWANILGAFTKTTPMISQTEQVRISETTTPMTTTVTTANPKKRVTTTTEAARETTTATTIAPKKRTRPPPKLVKQEKIKKHKRVTTTTTTSTTTTTNAPETFKRRPTHDLTPQASSAATGTTKSFRESHNKTLSASFNSTTTTSTTTTTTTTATPTTTTTKKIVVSTTQPKNKNRFRQSTLMLKGTSLKHDRWNPGNKAQLNATVTPTSSLYRRKGSNFQGYMSPITPRKSDKGREKDHEDRKPTTASTEANIAKVIATSETLYEETADKYETNSVLPLLPHEQGDSIYDEDTNDSKDNSEYTSQTSTSVQKKTIEQSTSLNELSSTPFTQAKNKTKCKKKKHNIPTTEEPNDSDSDSETLTEPITLVPSTARTASEISTGNDILDELLNFNFDSDEKLNKTSEKTEDDNSKSDEYADFLGVFEGVTKKPGDDNQYDDDDENESEDGEGEENYGGGNMLAMDDSTAFDDDEDDEKETVRDSNDDAPPHDRPFSFLELMAMS